MLEFLNPWMLAGAAAAAVPIVLHLIMRQRPSTWCLPALRFIVQRKDTNRRKLRLRHLLLLALRVAALCFFALALARPSLTSSDLMISAEDPVSAAMVFHTAPSMDYEQANQTRLQQAQGIALWLIDELPKDSQVAVLDSTTKQASFQVDLEAARKRIEKLETTVVPRGYQNVVAEALRLLKDKSAHEAREIYLFTDLTKSAWSAGDVAALNAALAGAKNVSIHVIDVGVQAPQNTAIVDLKLSPEVVPEKRVALLSVSVRRNGSKVTTPVELRIGGRDGIVDQDTLELDDGQSQVVPFELPTDLPAGPHQGEIRVVSQDRNLLGIDDRVYFTLRVVKPWKMLIASDDGAQADTIQIALAPPDAVAAGRAPFEIGEVVSLNELESAALGEFAAVCLVDPAPLSAATWDRLAEYVRGGGKLAVFLGRQAAQGAGRDSFNSESAQAILPGQLLLYADKTNQPVTIDPGDYSDPFLRRLGDDKDYLLWSFVRVKRYWLIQPTDNAVEVARYSDGDPALFSRPVGDGMVLVFTTPPADKAANNLLQGLDQSVTTGFLLLDRTMHHLVGGTRPPLNYLAAPELSIDVPLPQKPDGVVQALLRPPVGEATWPASLSDQAKISVTAAEGVGNYRLELKKIGLDEGFSVNLRPQDADLARATDDDLKAAFGATPYAVARNQGEVERLVRVSRKGQELFPYLIALVAIVLGIEHVLANRFYRHETAAGLDEKSGQPSAVSRQPDRQPEAAAV